MDAVSEHSTRKVDSPAMMQSDAPSLVKILSATDSWQDAAGTQQPTWARTTARHVALSRVLLPPMLGPVSKRALACLCMQQQCQDSAVHAPAICAKTTVRQVALSNVLLPPIVGPVNKSALACLQVQQQ